MTTECPQHLKQKIDAYIAACDNILEDHPYIVVMLMHDIFRNMYPMDPFIPLPENEHPLETCEKILDRSMTILSLFKGIGSYKMDLQEYTKSMQTTGELKDRTGKVYSTLWNEYPGDMVGEAEQIIRERFGNSNISLDLIKGKKVLDGACGSGRYACALARLGAAEVVGMDWSDEAMELGQQLADKNNIDNIRFTKGSLLDLPFEDNSFDFVFSNGVLMITGDLEKGTDELHRVLKPGGHAWYFIYGAGGFYWYIRKHMNVLMKKIPQVYTMEILKLIGMPMNRFIFCDNWYVPIEDHTSVEQGEALFKKIGFSDFRRAIGGRKTDYDNLVTQGSDMDRQMWGDGNLRYLLTK